MVRPGQPQSHMHPLQQWPSQPLEARARTTTTLTQLVGADMSTHVSTPSLGEMTNPSPSPHEAAPGIDAGMFAMPDLDETLVAPALGAMGLQDNGTDD
jgi:hypothetical protein